MAYKPGESGNLAGRPVNGLQDLSVRLKYWLERKTIQEIKDLVKDKEAWGKLLSIDGILVRRIEAAMRKDGSTADFTAVLDRLVGKPVQPIAAEFKVTHGLADRIKRAEQIVDGTFTETAKQIKDQTNNVAIGQAVHMVLDTDTKVAETSE